MFVLPRESGAAFSRVGGFAAVGGTGGALGRASGRAVRLALGRRAADSEVRSWERSLPVLAEDLRDAGLGQVEVLAEYQIPLTSK